MVNNKITPFPSACNVDQMLYFVNTKALSDILLFMCIILIFSLKDFAKISQKLSVRNVGLACQVQIPVSVGNNLCKRLNLSLLPKLDKLGHLALVGNQFTRRPSLNPDSFARRASNLY